MTLAVPCTPVFVSVTSAGKVLTLLKPLGNLSHTYFVQISLEMSWRRKGLSYPLSGWCLGLGARSVSTSTRVYFVVPGTVLACYVPGLSPLIVGIALTNFFLNHYLLDGSQPFLRSVPKFEAATNTIVMF